MTAYRLRCLALAIPMIEARLQRFSDNLDISDVSSRYIVEECRALESARNAYRTAFVTYCAGAVQCTALTPFAVGV